MCVRAIPAGNWIGNLENSDRENFPTILVLRYMKKTKTLRKRTGEERMDAVVQSRILIKVLNWPLRVIHRPKLAILDYTTPRRQGSRYDTTTERTVPWMGGFKEEIVRSKPSHTMIILRSPSQQHHGVNSNVRLHGTMQTNCPLTFGPLPG